LQDKNTPFFYLFLNFSIEIILVKIYLKLKFFNKKLLFVFLMIHQDLFLIIQGVFIRNKKPDFSDFGVT